MYPPHPGKSGMPKEEITIAEMLKSAGYTTGHVGKWHLGYTPETMPNGQGFDSSYGHMGGCIDNYSHFFYWVPPNRHDLWRDGKEIWEDGAYFVNSMVREAKAFIDRSKTSGNPFSFIGRLIGLITLSKAQTNGVATMRMPSSPTPKQIRSIRFQHG